MLPFVSKITLLIICIFLYYQVHLAFSWLRIAELFVYWPNNKILFIMTFWLKEKVGILVCIIYFVVFSVFLKSNKRISRYWNRILYLKYTWKNTQIYSLHLKHLIALMSNLLYTLRFFLNQPNCIKEMHVFWNSLFLLPKQLPPLFYKMQICVRYYYGGFVENLPRFMVSITFCFWIMRIVF